VAATQRLDDAGSVALCGIVVRADLRCRGLGRRLVTEVADALRAQVLPAWSSGWTVTTGQRRPC
jgi:ribosomal protein S18 acetylase RimI-like enzyme